MKDNRKLPTLNLEKLKALTHMEVEKVLGGGWSGPMNCATAVSCKCTQA